jgi:hypothetical protein
VSLRRGEDSFPCKKVNILARPHIQYCRYYAGDSHHPMARRGSHSAHGLLACRRNLPAQLLYSTYAYECGLRKLKLINRAVARERLSPGTCRSLSDFAPNFPKTSYLAIDPTGNLSSNGAGTGDARGGTR